MRVLYGASRLRWSFSPSPAVRVIQAIRRHSAPQILRRVGDPAQPPAASPEMGLAESRLCGHSGSTHTGGDLGVHLGVAGPTIPRFLPFCARSRTRCVAATPESNRASGEIELVSATASGEPSGTSTLRGLPGTPTAVTRSSPAPTAPGRTRTARCLQQGQDWASQQGDPERYSPPTSCRARTPARLPLRQPRPDYGEAGKASPETIPLLRGCRAALRRNLSRTLLLAAAQPWPRALCWTRTDPPLFLTLLGARLLRVVSGSFATRPTSAWVLPVGFALVGALRAEHLGLALGATWLAASCSDHPGPGCVAPLPLPSRNVSEAPGAELRPEACDPDRQPPYCEAWRSARRP